MQDFMNVKEPQILHDTILIGERVANYQFNAGWFTSFAAMAAQAEYPFFNVRNKNSGLPYCNLDTRDQTAYGMRVYQMGIQFFGPQIHTQILAQTDLQPADLWAIEELHTSIWETELPRHCSISLRVNQDDRIRINVGMASAGIGPTGGGMGHGDINQDPIIPAQRVSYPSIMKGMTAQGVPDHTNQWAFPYPLDVPRRATLSAVIKMSEYGRALVAQMLGPHFYPIVSGGSVNAYPCMFGIRVMLTVERYVQQRGEYHA